MPVTLADFVEGARVEHVRSRGWYRIVGIAKVEATMEDVVVYQSDCNGQLWTRPVSEFLDGRFEIAGYLRVDLDIVRRRPRKGDVIRSLHPVYLKSNGRVVESYRQGSSQYIKFEDGTSALIAPSALRFYYYESLATPTNPEDGEVL